MGQPTYIYGTITGAMADTDNTEKFHWLNSAVISQLTEDDEFQLLSGFMFATAQSHPLFWMAQPAVTGNPTLTSSHTITATEKDASFFDLPLQ